MDTLDKSAPSASPSNGDVARIFERIADVLEIQGENPYKIKAYRNAVDTLRSLDEPVSRIASEKRLDTIPGFGDAIRGKITDILETGTTNLYERIKDAVPDSVIEILQLPGIGGKTVKLLWEKLGVDSIESLEKAIDAGKVATIAGMGEKTAEKIRQSIERGQRFASGVRIDQAAGIVESLSAGLADRPELSSLMGAGELRRGADVVHIVDIVGVSTDPAASLDAFTRLPQVDKIVDRGPTPTAPSPFQGEGWGEVHHARVILHNGATVELTLADESGFAALLFRKTGSAAHVARVTEIPKSARDESEIYAAAGLPFIPVTLREDTGEIEAARAGKLPRLLTLEDIRGDVHAHTTATDGEASIAEMAAAALAHGYEYMAITDHSHSLAMVGGLTPERLRAQIAEIRALEDSLGIRVFAGSEVDIKADGSLDFDDDLLAALDFVIASSHLYNNQSREAQTRRMIKAIENPHVDLIAHPTGRLILRRDPYAVDVEALIEAAARTHTALEINAAPERLDLKDEYARQAASAGVKIMINTDAHRTVEYDLMHYGITTAQRAWLTPSDVVNALPLAEFEAWLKR